MCYYQVSKKNKYRIVFYKFCGMRFTRICTRTKWSAIKFALKTAIKNKAFFKIYRLNSVKLQ